MTSRVLRRWRAKRLGQYGSWGESVISVWYSSARRWPQRLAWGIRCCFSEEIRAPGDKFSPLGRSPYRMREMRIWQKLAVVFLVSMSGLAAEKEVVETDFIRIDEDEAAARLQTGITRYEKEGVTVDLLGAIHIGDQGYFEELNERFEDYEVLLFEMVGGENLVRGQVPQEPAREDAEPESPLEVLGDVYGMMTNALALSGQKDLIDYNKDNFVHADLTLAEFEKLQGEKEESILGFAIAAGVEAERANPENQLDPGKVLAAMLSGNTNILKLELMKQLGDGDSQLADFAGESVIISDRNAKCFKVLDQQIAKGKKTIGVFYGAAHFPDMEKRLLEKGYRQTKHEWLTAWDVPKPKPIPKAEPAEQKKAA